MMGIVHLCFSNLMYVFCDVLSFPHKNKSIVYTQKNFFIPNQMYHAHNSAR